jgi:predicted MPP superfamily phosphohydrolase
MIVLYIIGWIITIPREVLIFLLFIIVPLIAIYAVYKGDTIKIKKIDLNFKNLSENVRFILISDLHIGAIRGNRLLKQIVKKINNPENGKIDFVLIAGDIADGSSKIDSKSFEILAESKAPLFFTPGNHDFYPGINNVVDAAKAASITTLSNDCIGIKGVQLIGIPFAWQQYAHEIDGINTNISKKVEKTNNNHNDNKENNNYNVNNNFNVNNNLNENNNFNEDNNFNENNLKTSRLNAFSVDSINKGFDFDKIDSNKVSILMYHVPIGWDMFKSKGIDLMVSGHTHGGQFFPFNFVVKRLFPYLRGLYEDDGSFLYVSDGIGTLSPPMRLGTNAEMTVFHLKKER